jgi:hypothetical protein
MPEPQRRVKSLYALYFSLPRSRPGFSMTL